MKILRINSKRAFFVKPSEWRDGVSEDDQSFKPITNISKDDLIEIVDYLLTGEFEMDKCEEDSIANPAEMIVYKKIYEGLEQASKQKSKIMEDIDSRFDAAVKKYD